MSAVSSANRVVVTYTGHLILWISMLYKPSVRLKLDMTLKCNLSVFALLCSLLSTRWVALDPKELNLFIGFSGNVAVIVYLIYTIIAWSQNNIESIWYCSEVAWRKCWSDFVEMTCVINAAQNTDGKLEKWCGTDFLITINLAMKMMKQSWRSVSETKKNLTCLKI
jgi:hypothetical protein